MVDPRPEICSVPARHRHLAPALHRMSVARISSGRSDRCISPNARYSAPAVVPWSRSALARTTIDFGRAGGIAHLFRYSRRHRRTIPIQRSRESSRISMEHRNRLYDRSIHIGGWILRQSPPDLSIAGGVRWNPVSRNSLVWRGMAGTKIAKD